MPRSGVSHSSFLEWILAAVWANYRPDEFLELDGEVQSLIVAAYQAQIQIEAVLDKERVKTMKQASKAKS